MKRITNPYSLNGWITNPAERVEPYAMYAADKAYVDLEALRRIHHSNAFFVVRPKSNMKFVFKEELTDSEPDSNIVGDYVVELARKSAKDLYPDELKGLSFTLQIWKSAHDVLSRITHTSKSTVFFGSVSTYTYPHSGNLPLSFPKT